MADDLRIFGNTYNNAVGVKLTDTNGNEVVYTAGGGSGVDKVHVCVPTYDEDTETITFAETWSEIKSYLDNGYIVAVRFSTPTQTLIQYGSIVKYDSSTGIYSFTTIRYNGLTVDTTTYTTDSADGHPILFD